MKNITVMKHTLFFTALLLLSISVKLNAQVWGTTSIPTTTSGNCYIGGDNDVTGNNNVTGNNIISGYATIGGNETVTGNSAIGGTATITGNIYMQGGTFDMTMLTDADRTIFANSEAHTLFVQSGTFANPGASITLRSHGYGDNGAMQLYTTGTGNCSGFTFYNTNASPGMSLLNISTGGLSSFTTNATTGNSAVFYN